jgi:hypothetical protein
MKYNTLRHLTEQLNLVEKAEKTTLLLIALIYLIVFFNLLPYQSLVT